MDQLACSAVVDSTPSIITASTTIPSCRLVFTMPLLKWSRRDNDAGSLPDDYFSVLNYSSAFNGFRGDFFNERGRSVHGAAKAGDSVHWSCHCHVASILTWMSHILLRILSRSRSTFEWISNASLMLHRSHYTRGAYISKASSVDCGLSVTRVQLISESGRRDEQVCIAEVSDDLEMVKRYLMSWNEVTS